MLELEKLMHEICSDAEIAKMQDKRLRKCLKRSFYLLVISGVLLLINTFVDVDYKPYLIGAILFCEILFIVSIIAVVGILIKMIKDMIKDK